MTATTAEKFRRAATEHSRKAQFFVGSIQERLCIHQMVNGAHEHGLKTTAKLNSCHYSMQAMSSHLKSTSKMLFTHKVCSFTQNNNLT